MALTEKKGHEAGTIVKDFIGLTVDAGRRPPGRQDEGSKATKGGAGRGGDRSSPVPHITV